MLNLNLNAQTIEKDTLIARNWLNKAKELKKSSKFDEALINLEEAKNIYQTYKLDDLLLRCELEKGGILTGKRDLNKAFEILSVAAEKLKSSEGENNALYSDFLNKIGLVYAYAGNYTLAEENWQKTLKIRKKVYGNKHLKVTNSLNNLGGLYTWTGDYYKSIRYHKETLKLRKELLPDNDLSIAVSLNNLGSVYNELGSFDIALDYYSESLKIKKTHLDPLDPGLASIYNNLGVIYFRLGEYERSITNYNNALLIRQKSVGENHSNTADVYANIAVVFNAKGEYNRALEFHMKALLVFENTYGEKHPSTAKAYRDIGAVYLNMGNDEKASDFINKALQITESIYGNNNKHTANLLVALGVIMYENHRDETALDYYLKALIIQKEIYEEAHYDIAETLRHIGIIYKEKKQFDKAFDYYNESLTICLKIFGDKHPKTVQIYNLLANLYDAQSDYETELIYLQKALVSNIEYFNNLDLKSNPDLNSDTTVYFDQKRLIETLKRKADVYAKIYLRDNKIEDLTESYFVYEILDIVINRTKSTLANTKDKIDLAKDMSDIYEKAIPVCMKLFQESNLPKYFYKAFEYSEMNKAGILLEALASAEAKKFAGIPDSLIRYENELLSQIAYFRTRISEKPMDYKSRLELFSLKREYNDFIKQIEFQYQDYYNLKYNPYKVKINEIKSILDSKTAVISYFTTERSDFIYIFVIQNDRADIRFVLKTDKFDDNLNVFRMCFFSNKEANMKSFAQKGHYLYKQLIPKIVTEDKKIKNLIIIPDGNLGQIPFEVLLTKEYDGTWDAYHEYPYLVKKYAVSYSYSVNLFHKTFSKEKQKDIEITELNDWLALAPVFDDEHQKGVSKKTRELLKTIDESEKTNTRAFMLNGEYITHLPGSENEVKAIYNEFKSKEKKALLKTHMEANEAFVKSNEFENFKYIHIATHGFVNSESPDLSGILLAQDSTGGNDGVLYMGEIFNLRLHSELVVLSACETGLGKYERGEGVIGLTRALLYAGTKNIIVSLWQVSDESTEQLMIDFYKDFLDKYDDTEEFSEALRSAKLKLINEGKYAHPFYWSPFILIGK